MDTHAAPSPTDIRSLVSKLERNCKQIVSDAADLAYRRGHIALDIEHVLLAFCNAHSEPVLQQAAAMGFNIDSARRELERQLDIFKTGEGLPPALSDRLVGLLRDAWMTASIGAGDQAVSVALFLRTITESERLFVKLCHDVPSLLALRSFLVESAASASTDEEKSHADMMVHSTLAKYTIDLTARAATGEIDPVIGRDSEISQMVEILLRRRQNNPILVGEAGVGKTAIVEGLAQRISKQLVPQALLGVRVCSLDMGLLRAGASMRGEMESRLKAIIAEVATSEKPVILFIDEAHTLVAGAAAGGEQSDIANLIKPELARGTLRTIAATTWSEYKRYFEKDAALTRRFQTVQVNEPTTAAAEDILQGLVPILQKHHGVYVMQSAIEAAVRLSTRYIQGRQLPDKAISVLDTACARAVASLSGPAYEQVSLSQRVELLTGRLAALERERDWVGAGDDHIAAARVELETIQAHLNATTSSTLISRSSQAVESSASSSSPPAVRVTGEDVAGVIADWTGVPSQKMLLDQYSIVTRLEETLTKRVVGQEMATHVLCDRLRAYTAKLEDPNRPIGVFMLVGPSGVGKTETAHALAEAFFGKSSMTVINMSEYQEAHTVSKLKGAPAGYVGFGQGGVLTEAIRRRPYGLLLLDEVEKAHPDVLNLFLQVFDKGFMEDSEGIVVDFKNTLVILTSNAGSELLESFGNPQERTVQEREALDSVLRQRLLKNFTPAFLGRTQVVPYFALTEQQLGGIVNMKLKTISERFGAAYQTDLRFDKDVLKLIVTQSNSATIGARLIDRYISENILSRLSSYVLDCLAGGRKVQAVRVAQVQGQVTVEPESVEPTPSKTKTKKASSK